MFLQVAMVLALITVGDPSALWVQVLVGRHGDADGRVRLRRACGRFRTGARTLHAPAFGGLGAPDEWGVHHDTRWPSLTS